MVTEPEEHSSTELRRDIGFWLFLLYGVGNIVGAGIYVLIGKVAGEAGYGAPLAFGVAAVVAGLTGRSYGELAARYPRSAGEAVYLYKAFNLQWLSTAVGLVIALAGLVSAATIARGFVGYFTNFLILPWWLIVAIALVVLTLIAARGIVESAVVNAGFTLTQVFGLVWIIVAGLFAVPDAEVPAMSEFLPSSGLAWGGVMAGAFLAFYAFIGFEDMVNIAEEVRDPQATIPRGIMAAFALSTVIYVLLAAVAVIAVGPALLAGSDAPLAAVCAEITGCYPALISLIGLTVVNGALIQIIMASRIVYGMSRSGWLPGFFAAVDARRRTPVRATVLAGAVALLLALTLPFISLAKLTSTLVLTIFILVNLSLIVIKRREPAPEGVAPTALWVPALSLAGSVFILLY